MTHRIALTYVFFAAIIVAGFLACLFVGTYHLDPSDVSAALTGASTNEVARVIVGDIRVPMAVTATLAGAALAVAGLLMQTTFNNPLAGPSVLGVSTGSSLGVALVLLGGFGGASAAGATTGILLGALAGAAIVIFILLAFSSVVRSATMLLIVGIMIGYLISSAVSLLNFFSTQEGVHSFVIWGLGNFSGVNREILPVFSTACLALLICALMMVKPLNAMLLGERYAASMGVNVKRARTLLLAISGALTAVVTAWCGPIAFIGMTVPHIARMATHSANHTHLLTATILAGAATGLISLLISVLPGQWGMIPINAITPVIGVPVILYVILNRRKTAL